jgi:hypothetical protein
MELFCNGRNFLVRVRTTDGAEGIAVPNAMHLIHTYPIFINRVALFFVGKDARQLEPMLWELPRRTTTSIRASPSGSARRLPIRDPRPAREADGQGDRRPGVGSNGGRWSTARCPGNTPEEEAPTSSSSPRGAGRKFRLGGRMSKNADSLPGRTEKLSRCPRGVRRDDALRRLEQPYDVPRPLRSAG